MNVEISNEVIEKMLQTEIQKRVTKWFSDYENKNAICDLVKETVEYIVKQEIYKQPINIQSVADNLEKDLVVNKCAEQICDVIADAFADKYGY